VINVTAGETVNFSGSFSDPAGNFDAGAGWDGRMNYGGTGYFSQTVTQTGNTDYDVSINPRTYANGIYNATLRVCEENNLYGFCSTAVVQISVTGGTTSITDNVGTNLPEGTVGTETQEEGDVLGAEDQAFELSISDEYFVQANETNTFAVNVAGTDSAADLECVWDFGNNGETRETSGEEATSVEYTYTEDGTYELTVTCSDAEGNEVETSSTVLVGQEAAEENNTGNVDGETTEQDPESNPITDNALPIIVIGLIILVLIVAAIFYLLSRAGKQQDKF
jgi:hypothetical protein